MSHTPGPWKADLDQMGCRTIYADAAHESLATVYTERPTTLGYTHGLHDDETDRDNTQLMSASPDLLEACKYALGILESMPSDCQRQLEGILDESIDLPLLERAIEKADPAYMARYKKAIREEG